MSEFLFDISEDIALSSAIIFGFWLTFECTSLSTLGHMALVICKDFTVRNFFVNVCRCSIQDELSRITAGMSYKGYN